jgi:WD40 repeat protein
VNNDGSVKLLDVTDPRHVRILATDTGHTDEIRSVRFSPIGQTLVSVSLPTRRGCGTGVIHENRVP